MYEDITYTGLLEEKLNKVTKEIDKIEGSIVHDSLALNSFESYQIYQALRRYFDESFADTASRPYLIRHGADIGIYPHEATFAVLRAEFDCKIEKGTRFYAQNLTYVTLDRLSSDSYSYALKCEIAGALGNTVLGVIRPIDVQIDGLRRAELIDLLVPGADAESTDDFRKRYFDQFSGFAFGGNIADYKDMFAGFEGVGGVKVEPVWQGGGTVKVAFLKEVEGVVPRFSVPSDEEIAAIQEKVDPEGFHGLGMGLAPIGHNVTVAACDFTVVDVSLRLVYNGNFSSADVAKEVERIIDGYFDELNESWESSESIVVRIAQIESRLLGIPQILDVLQTKLNGSEVNLILSKDSVAVRGNIAYESEG